MSSLRKTIFFTLVLFSLILSACGENGGGSNPSSAEQALTQVAQNVSTGLTQTAASIASAQPVATETQIATETPVPPTADSSLIPTLGNLPTLSSADMTAMPSGQGTVVAPPPEMPNQAPTSADVAECKLRANLEYENIPDGTQMPLGKEFTKTWRLKNSGTCDWPAGTELMFQGGELMGAGTRIVLLTQALYPNQYVEAVVDFKTPTHPGKYRGNWMLVTPQGHIFGTGDNGKGMWWVEIVAYKKGVTQPTP